MWYIINEKDVRCYNERYIINEKMFSICTMLSIYFISVLTSIFQYNYYSTSYSSSDLAIFSFQTL